MQRYCVAMPKVMVDGLLHDNGAGGGQGGIGEGGSTEGGRLGIGEGETGGELPSSVTRFEVANVAFDVAFVVAFGNTDGAAVAGKALA